MFQESEWRKGRIEKSLRLGPLIFSSELKIQIWSNSLNIILRTMTVRLWHNNLVSIEKPMVSPKFQVTSKVTWHNKNILGLNIMNKISVQPLWDLSLYFSVSLFLFYFILFLNLCGCVLKAQPLLDPHSSFWFIRQRLYHFVHFFMPLKDDATSCVFHILDFLFLYFSF